MKYRKGKISINDAIKWLTDLKSYVEPQNQPEETDALALGVEGLKQIKYLREIHILHDNELLPGEHK